MVLGIHLFMYENCFDISLFRVSTMFSWSMRNMCPYFWMDGYKKYSGLKQLF